MTTRERRMLAWAGAAVAGALCLRATPIVARKWAEARDTIRAQAELAARLRQEVAAVKEMSAEAVTVRQRFVALDTAILAGQSEAEAAGSLAAHLNLAADRAGALLQQAAPAADTVVAGPLHRVTAHATLSADSRGLIKTLHSLAMDPVAIAIQSIRIVAPDPASADNVPESLSLELEVSGWYQVRRP